MLSNITEKLEKIRDEVNEFHPLLKILLPKLEGIKGVEYKHGTNEMGADFVLAKHDVTLDKLDYIGVIVKTVKITQSYLHEVERQIEECDLPKYFDNGHKLINLSEIWIICNNTISGNAEQKIYHKYHSKKIYFINNFKLSQLIEKYLPEYLYDIPIAIGDYLSQLNVKNDTIDKNLSLIQLNDKSFYIGQDIIQIDEGEYNIKQRKRKKSKITKVDINDKIIHNQFIIIEAEMGAGKSKFIRKLVSDYTSPSTYSQYKSVPINISYKTFYEKYQCKIEDTIKSELNDQIRSEVDKDPDIKILLIIDGFDEKRDTLENQLSILDQIGKDASSKQNIRVILTTRYINPFSNKKLKISSASILEIAPLSQIKMIEVLSTLCTEINLTNRIIEDLKRSPLIKDLTRKPIAAILLARLMNENTIELPSNITELFSKYLELMLGRWDIDKGLETQKEYEVSEIIIMDLAKYFIDNNIDYISKTDCQGFFDKYLSKRNIGININDLCDKVIKRSGIIFEDQLNSNIYFTHRTFAEYYYSKLKFKDKSIKIDNKVFELYWLNIFFFYVGLHKDCPDLLNEIVNVEPTSEGQRWLKIVNMSNYFLAGFASPYEVIENNFHLTLIDAAKLYLDIFEGRLNKSPFASFTEIKLLWLIQYLIRDSYAYDFFHKAIDNVILNIDYSDEEDIVKIYALFFAGVISIDMENKDPFNFIIDKYSTKIPANIKIALYLEGDNLENQSDILKRQIKKTKRFIKSLDKKEIDRINKQPISMKSIK